MAHLAWVIQEEVVYLCMVLRLVLQVNKIMVIGQSRGCDSLSMGLSGGSGLSMYGSSSSVTGK